MDPHNAHTANDIQIVAQAIAGARPGLPARHWGDCYAEAKAAISVVTNTVQLPAKFPPHVSTDHAQAYNAAMDMVHAALDRAGIAWVERP